MQALKFLFRDLIKSLSFRCTCHLQLLCSSLSFKYLASGSQDWKLQLEEHYG